MKEKNQLSGLERQTLRAKRRAIREPGRETQLAFEFRDYDLTRARTLLREDPGDSRDTPSSRKYESDRDRTTQ